MGWNALSSLQITIDGKNSSFEFQLEKWPGRSLSSTKFITWDRRLRTSSVEKDPGSCFMSKFNRSERCVLVLVKINHIRKSADCGSKK